ncbi:MAG: ATP-binding protein [Thiohalocapsa sp.]
MTNPQLRLLLSLPVLIGIAGCAWAGSFDSTLGSITTATALAAYVWLASYSLTRPVRALADATPRLLPGSATSNSDGAVDRERIERSLTAARGRLEANATRISELETRLAATRIALARAEAAKRAFLGSVGHELRTPLNAIIGMTRLTIQTSLSPRQRDYVERADRAAHQLLGQIDDILDYVRLEAGNLRIELSEFEPNEAIDAVVRAAKDSANEKLLTVRVERDPDLPNKLIGDAGRIRQVLTELVDNAIKFTEDGEIVIATQLLERTDERAQVSFEVRDTGIGIDRARQQEVFTIFSPGDASTTRRRGGAGLGLGISGRLVSALGGRLRAARLPERGSSFTFSVPLALPGTMSSSTTPEACSDSNGGPTQSRGLAAEAKPHTNPDPARLVFKDDSQLGHRLLKRFRSDHAGFVDDYISLYGSGDQIGAAHLAVALESAAGSLGANELKASAARLAMKRRDRDDPSADLGRVQQLLDALLAEIDEKLADPPRAKMGTTKTPAPAASDDSQIAGLLRHLSDLLTDFDAAAINHFESGRQLLVGYVSHERIDDLQRAINRFDFTLAQHRLRHLAADLGIPLRETS